MNRISPFTCPGCGVEISPNARGCSSCGTRIDGWGVPAHSPDLEADEEEFDYEEFIEEEFGPKTHIKPKHISWFWWVAAILVAAAFGTLIVRH